jgi:hypothetical protein
MTENDLTKRAEELRVEATSLLDELPWIGQMRQLGSIRPVGSYALDLMAWPDLDLHWVLPENLPVEKAFSRLLEALIPDPGWRKANFRNFLGDFKPQWPRGLYLGCEVKSPCSDRIWKIDIWVQSSAVMEAGWRFLDDIAVRITPAKRRLILEAKQLLMGQEGRVPKMGSFYLYQAVCHEGLEDWMDIQRFLIDHGVAISSDSVG